jgi:hypothetical protein
MTQPNGALAAAAEVERFCRRQKWGFCFIGGVAVQRWGEPRFTQDVDFTVLTKLGAEEKFIDALLKQYTARVPNPRKFALETRVVLARTKRGINLDISLGAFPYDEACVKRASAWKIKPRMSITTCSAEDLVINKVLASRDRDWADVESVLQRQGRRLDLKVIRKELPGLIGMTEHHDSLEKFERLVKSVNRQLRK